MSRMHVSGRACGMRQTWTKRRSGSSQEQNPTPATNPQRIQCNLLARERLVMTGLSMSGCQQSKSLMPEAPCRAGWDGGSAMKASKRALQASRCTKGRLQISWKRMIHYSYNSQPLMAWKRFLVNTTVFRQRAQRCLIVSAPSDN